MPALADIDITDIDIDIGQYSRIMKILTGLSHCELGVALTGAPSLNAPGADAAWEAATQLVVMFDGARSL